MKQYSMLVGTLAIFCLAGGSSWGQTTDSPMANTLYAELGGSAGFVYNVGYDRLLYTNGRNKLAVAAGFQYLPTGQSIPVHVSFSPQISYLLGRLNHLELGVGTIHSTGERNSTAATLRIGYRYQRPDGGTFFKIGFTPILFGVEIFGETLPVFPWGGFAFGWTF